MSSEISQLSFFSAGINSRRQHFYRRSCFVSAKFLSGKVLNVKSSDGNGTNLSRLYNVSSTQPHSAAASSSVAGARRLDSRATKEGSDDSRLLFWNTLRSVKNLDLGGLVFCEGLVGFLISRNLRTLVSGLLFGTALLALSTLSLKFWRKGKPSFPYIIGQAALSLALLFKHSHAYTSTTKFFPTGINVVISAAMLCFYTYVLIAGGNPPPKKLKPTPAVETS